MVQLAARHAAHTRSASMQSKASNYGESVGLGIIAKGDEDAESEGKGKDKDEENVEGGPGRG